MPSGVKLGGSKRLNLHNGLMCYCPSIYSCVRAVVWLSRGRNNTYYSNGGRCSSVSTTFIQLYFDRLSQDSTHTCIKDKGLSVYCVFFFSSFLYDNVLDFMKRFEKGYRDPSSKVKQVNVISSACIASHEDLSKTMEMNKERRRKSFPNVLTTAVCLTFTHLWISPG